MIFVGLSTDPAEIRLATQASHMITCTILRNQSSARDALCDQQVPSNGRIETSKLTTSLMPRFLAIEATHAATRTTLGLLIATTFGFSNDTFTVWGWAKLQVFALANDHILVDSLKDLKLLLRHISTHILNLESLDTVLLHAFDLEGFSAVDI